MTWNSHRGDVRHQLLLLTFLNAFGVRESFKVIADVSEMLRSHLAVSLWLFHEMAIAFWPMELWLTSIYASHLAFRRGLIGVAILIAALPLFSHFI